MRRAARLRQVPGSTARRPLGLRWLCGRQGRTGPRRRRRRSDRCDADGRRRLLRDQRAGARRRRAGSRQDERNDALRRRRRSAERGRRDRQPTEAARLAPARQRLEPRAAARGQPAARALARRLLADADSPQRRRSRGRTHLRSRCSRRSTSRTRKRCVSSGRSRWTAPTSTRASSARPLASSSPRRYRRPLPFKQPTDSTDRRARHRARPEPRRPPVVAPRLVAPDVPHQARRAGRRRPRGRSSNAGTSIARRRSPGLGMLTMLTVDLAKGLVPVNSVGVMTDARIVYASPDNLYLATERWADRPRPETPTEPQPSVTTAIHRFDISDPTRTTYRGSGQVSGYLLNQWSLSEYDGVLRVVSTDAPAWFDSSDSSAVVADDAAPRRRRAQPDRPRRQSRQGRARLRGPLRRPDRVRRHVQADRPALHGRSRRPRAAARARRARAPRLLGLPAPDRSRPAARHRAGRRRPGPASRHPALALRRLRPPASDAPRARDARPGLVRGGVRPPRVPLLAADGPRRRALRPAGGRLPRRAGARDHSSRAASPTRQERRPEPRSGGPWWSATASSRSPTPASRRAASARSLPRAGPRSRRRRRFRGLCRFRACADACCANALRRDRAARPRRGADRGPRRAAARRRVPPLVAPHARAPGRRRTAG